MARKKATVEQLRTLNKVREFKRRRNMHKAAGAGPGNKGENVCAICDDGGNLTCCEGCCQRSFHLDNEHNCIKTLGLTIQEAKNIIEKEDFICKNCQYKQHQCFICGSLGSSDDTDTSSQQVFQCEHDDCARFYHPKCVAQMLYPDSQELFELHVAAGESFTCPMHECIVCKEVDNKKDKSMQFAVCRRCPTVYHRKCLPRDIIFKPKKGRRGPMRRAWKNMLPDRILIFCMYATFHTFITHTLNDYPSFPVTSVFPPALLDFVNLFYRKHEIVRELQTPARNHIVFPESNVLKTFQALYAQREAPDHSSSKQTHSSPPPAARDQNQCYCSSPLCSFAPSSVFMRPHPGSSGWLDD
uniref:Zinc finger PHD-type domain-containing protein n=1 Tax=Zea mays TaxID=4577 RepID=A0A804N495_MAIZE